MLRLALDDFVDEPIPSISKDRYPSVVQKGSAFFELFLVLKIIFAVKPLGLDEYPGFAIFKQCDVHGYGLPVTVSARWLVFPDHLIRVINIPA